MTTATVLTAARRRGSLPSQPVFSGMASLFMSNQRGAYFDFTDRSTLAVNADGSGGTPVVSGQARWCRDLGPNANHLRNTLTSVAVRSDGVVSSGTNYGLFNMPGFGNWPAIPEPLTMVVCLEILAFGATDDRLVGCSGTGQILQGTSSGRIRLFSNYSPEVQAGLNQEVLVTAVWDGARSSFALNGDAPVNWTSANGVMDALCLGSGTGPGPCASARFKRLFVREGLLSAGDRQGVQSWAAA